MLKLLDYQEDVVEECLEHSHAGDNPMLVLPAGAGKKEVTIEVASRLANEGRRPLFITDRKSLLTNFREWTNERGRDCDAVMAQTAVNAAPSFWDKYNVVIIDEAHDLRESLLLRLILHSKTYVGMTATPFTKGLQNFYGPIVSGPTTNDMVREGKLV